MAILKPLETPQGAIGTYSKIVKAEIFAEGGFIEVSVDLYASPEARDAGKSLLWRERVQIPFSALTQDPRDLLYPMLTHFQYSPWKGGAGDVEGNGAPTNFEINLTPEAMEESTVERAGFVSSVTAAPVVPPPAVPSLVPTASAGETVEPTPEEPING